MKGASKNYLRCHHCVKNKLVRESDQNAHLQLVKSSATPTVLRLLDSLALAFGASLRLLLPLVVVPCADCLA
jgi:hypothetical protein